MLIGLGCMSFYHDLKSSQHSFVDLKWQTLRNIPKENLKKAISLPLSLGLWNGRNYSRNWAISSRHQSDLRLLQELARAGSPSDLTINYWYRPILIDDWLVWWNITKFRILWGFNLLINKFLLHHFQITLLYTVKGERGGAGIGEQNCFNKWTHEQYNILSLDKWVNPRLSSTQIRMLYQYIKKYIIYEE